MFRDSARGAVGTVGGAVVSLDRHLIVCYDSVDDYRRNKLSKTLLDYGTRIQGSVFECIVEPGLADELVVRLKRLVDKWPEDRVCIVDLCGNCRDKLRTLGSSPRGEAPKSRVV